jgi:hypothetical protein
LRVGWSQGWPCGQQSRPESGSTPTRAPRDEATHPRGKRDRLRGRSRYLSGTGHDRRAGKAPNLLGESVGSSFGPATEFFAYLAAVVGVLIAAGIVDESNAGGLGAKQVRSYERAHKDRASVVEATERELTTA